MLSWRIPGQQRHVLVKYLVRQGNIEPIVPYSHGPVRPGAGHTSLRAQAQASGFQAVCQHVTQAAGRTEYATADGSDGDFAGRPAAGRLLPAAPPVPSPQPGWPSSILARHGARLLALASLRAVAAPPLRGPSSTRPNQPRASPLGASRSPEHRPAECASDSQGRGWDSPGRRVQLNGYWEN